MRLANIQRGIHPRKELRTEPEADASRNILREYESASNDRSHGIGLNLIRTVTHSVKTTLLNYQHMPTMSSEELAKPPKPEKPHNIVPVSKAPPKPTLPITHRLADSRPGDIPHQRPRLLLCNLEAQIKHGIKQVRKLLSRTSVHSQSSLTQGLGSRKPEKPVVHPPRANVVIKQRTRTAVMLDNVYYTETNQVSSKGQDALHSYLRGSRSVESGPSILKSARPCLSPLGTVSTAAGICNTKQGERQRDEKRVSSFLEQKQQHSSQSHLDSVTLAHTPMGALPLVPMSDDKQLKPSVESKQGLRQATTTRFFSGYYSNNFTLDVKRAQLNGNLVISDITSRDPPETERGNHRAHSNEPTKFNEKGEESHPVLSKEKPSQRLMLVGNKFQNPKVLRRLARINHTISLLQQVIPHLKMPLLSTNERKRTCARARDLPTLI